MLQPLLLNCDNDGEKLIFLENVERYPILRLDDPYRVDRNKSFHFPFGLAGYQDDEKMARGYNESAIRSALKLRQWLKFLMRIRKKRI